MGDAFCISQDMLGLAAITHSPELEHPQFIGKDSAARQTVGSLGACRVLHVSFSSSLRDETVGEPQAWKRGLGVVCLASDSCDDHKKSHECAEGKAKCLDEGLLAVKTRMGTS